MKRYTIGQREYIEQRKEDLGKGLGGFCEIFEDGKQCDITCPILEKCFAEEYDHTQLGAQSSPLGTGQSVLSGTQAIQDYYESGLVPKQSPPLEIEIEIGSPLEDPEGRLTC